MFGIIQGRTLGLRIESVCFSMSGCRAGGFRGYVSGFVEGLRISDLGF